MRPASTLVGLMLRERRPRLLALLAFAALFLAAASSARFLLGTDHGQVEIGRLFEVGGYPLASSMLLLGWLLGRFPLIASLVLMAGLFSRDRAAGYARLYAVRPVSLLGTYALLFAALAGLAFLLGALLMPAFDLVMLGSWAGPATLVLVAAEVIAYGGLVAFLSVWTRGDAWLALFLALFATLLHTLDAGNLLVGIAPGLRQVLALVLPPQGAMLALEGAYGTLQPIPWDAAAWVTLYGVFMLLLAGLSLTRRDL